MRLSQIGRAIIDRLTSVTSTAGDTLTLTSDGGTVTLTPSTPSGCRITKTASGSTSNLTIQGTQLDFGVSDSSNTTSFSTTAATTSFSSTTNNGSSALGVGEFNTVQLAGFSATDATFVNETVFRASSAQNSVTPLNANERVYAYYDNGITGTGTIWSIGLNGETYQKRDAHVVSDTYGLMLGAGTGGGSGDVRIRYNGTNTLFTNLIGSGTYNFDSGVNVTGTMAATTVTGANVTSGLNPGHTHNSSGLDMTAAYTWTGAHIFNTSNARVNSKLLLNTAATAAELNLLVNGTTTPGAHYVVGSSGTEVLWESSQSTGTPAAGWYGFRCYQDEASTGDLFFQGVNDGTGTHALVLHRGTGRVSVGTAVGTALGGEALGVNGLIRAQGGATFNNGGGSTDPNNFFKVFDSSGSGGTPWLYINTHNTTGGVGVHTTSITGGVLNYGAGRKSTSKAGLNVALASVDDNLLEWSGISSYSSSSYGFGRVQNEASGGDQILFAKNGTATDSTVMYYDRTNQQVGIGPGWSFASPPQYALDVNGKIHTDNEIEIDGALNHDGTTVGFYTVTPTTRPTAYTQTYSTATRTHSNLTAATLTDSSGGTADQTVAAISGTGDDADINNNFAELVDEINKLIADVTNVKQVLNQVIDDHQLNGLLQ